MKALTIKDIERLGLHDATVNACLIAQRAQQGISREDMLMAMVWYLVEDKQAVTAKLFDCERNRILSGMPLPEPPGEGGR